MKLGKRSAAWMSPLLVALLTFVVFLPSLQNGFVTWDDDRNFTDNLHYRGLGLRQLAWMWTTFHMGHYVPLSWMTLGLDYTLWGMNPAGYHLTNTVLHTANAVLVYFFARRILRLTARARTDSETESVDVPAALAALLFSVHPLRVESVAWVTERRDVLSLLFCLTSILCYLIHVEVKHDRRWYILAVVAFVAALLSKATSMVVPAILALLNVYPLRRVGGAAGWWSEPARRVYAELAPFALFAGAAASLSIVALHPPAQLGIAAKLAVSAYSLVFYVWKTVVPTGLSPVYEMPQHIDPVATRFVGSFVVAIALSALALAPQVRRRWPGVSAAWVAFVVITLPMLGIVQNGPQIAADRYTYHAAPALAILAAAGFAAAARRFAIPARTTAAAVVAVLGVLAWKQTGVWHDSGTLWSHVVRLDDDSSIGQVGLATVLMRQDRVAEAMEHYARGVALDHDYAEGHNNYGVALARQGKLAEAAEQYRLALEIRPEYDEAHVNWGAVMAQQGEPAQAIEHYATALAINPENANARVNWGNALVRLGKADEAIGQYKDALRLRPDNADAHLNWGVALAQEGKLAEAIEHFRAALAIDPQQAEAKDYLDRALRLQRDRPVAPSDRPTHIR